MREQQQIKKVSWVRAAKLNSPPRPFGDWYNSQTEIVLDCIYIRWNQCSYLTCNEHAESGVQLVQQHQEN